MKKFKLKWQYFLFVILIIVFLGSLIYFLDLEEYYNCREGMTNNSVTNDKNTKKKIKETITKLSKAHKNTNNKIDNVTKPDSKPHSNTDSKPDHNDDDDHDNAEVEGFSNHSFAPVNNKNVQSVSCQKYGPNPQNTTNFFGSTYFKPECCINPESSSYSNSQGCACLSPDKWRYLNSRGGNRTFTSEF